jgi:hypothetical protein
MPSATPSVAAIDTIAALDAAENGPFRPIGPRRALVRDLL